MTMEEKAETIWIMVVLKPCPKELAARSVMVMASASSTRPGCLARQVNARAVSDVEDRHIFSEIVHADALTHGHQRCVAGLHQRLIRRQITVAVPVGAADVVFTYVRIPTQVKPSPSRTLPVSRPAAMVMASWWNPARSHRKYSGFARCCNMPRPAPCHP